MSSNSIEEKVRCLSAASISINNLVRDFSLACTKYVGQTKDYYEHYGKDGSIRPELLIATCETSGYLSERLGECVDEINLLKEGLGDVDPEDVPEEYRPLLNFLQ